MTVTIIYDSEFIKKYVRPCQTCKMNCFAKIVNGWKLWTIFVQHFILDVWEGSEYASTNGRKLDKNVYLATIMSSFGLAFFLIRRYMSIVNNVDARLNIEVKSLISAAIITASIIPLNPTHKNKNSKQSSSFLELSGTETYLESS